MKNIPENKDIVLDYADAAQQSLNRAVLVGIFKVIIRTAYIISMGLPMLILIVGIGFCSIHFSFVTAILSLIFAIFLFVVSHMVDKESKNYLGSIGEDVEGLSSIYIE